MNNKRIDEIEEQIEDLRLELFQLLVPHPIGFPIYVWDRWKRTGTLKGFIKVNGKAAIVMETFTKDQTRIDYYCYDPNLIKALK